MESGYLSSSQLFVCYIVTFQIGYNLESPAKFIFNPILTTFLSEEPSNSFLNVLLSISEIHKEFQCYPSPTPP